MNYATISEAKLQAKIIKFLKEKGAYVIKTRPGPGTPVGCPDILFLCEGAWGSIEVKASKGARYQPGQEATLARLQEWSPFVYTVDPENWDLIRKELLLLFF